MAGEAHARDGATARYAAALIAVAAAVVLRMLIDPYLGDRFPFATFFLAVVVTGWFGGLGPALLAVVLGYLAADWFFIPPRGQISMVGVTPDVVVGAAVYFAVGVGTALIGGSMRAAEHRAAATAAEAEARSRALEAEIRERKRISGALVENEGRLEEVFERLTVVMDATGMGTWDLDLHSHQVRDSARMSEILGFEPVEVLRPAEERRRGLHPDDRETVQKALDAAVQGRADYEVEYRVVWPDNTVHWIASTGKVVRDASGAPVRVVGAALDFSERRLAEEARARLAAIVESSDDAIVGKGLDGIITDWNAGAERLFGYSRTEAIGRPVLMLVPPERRDEEERILAALRRGERIDHFETERVRKDGARLQVSISVSPIKDRAGRISGAAKIARDIGARKEIEAERERLLHSERVLRAEAEAASRAKDTFLATVSHELRTPLSPILAWARMLREGKLDDGKVRQAIVTIERNARSQVQLIDDLLDVSRIVAGKLRLQMRPTALAPVIEAAVEVVRPAADAKGVRLEVLLDSEVSNVAGDPERLQQVVWNLLSNAVKFTPKGGRVQVLLERVDSRVEIAVSDTGLGIKGNFLPHIFERFQQADAGYARQHGGLGLGLAIVRHIVELHGGTVHVESEGEGKGSTFTVKLPVLVFARTAGETSRRHPAVGTLDNHNYPSLEGWRILVVDDEPDSNEVVSTLLDACGAEVRVAASAAQALETVGRWKPDVIVTDIGMPGEDGYSLLAALQGRADEIAGVPVVALTAYASTEDRVRLLSAGFRMHVPKPIEPAELVTVVANVARAIRR